MDKIFVQVAAYRDPELLPTLESAISNAKHPERLVFGMCWQYHPDDMFTKAQRELLKSKQAEFRLVELDLSKTTSNGACWARHQLQQLYEGETYTLQIDSHMRFVPEWDEKITDMYEGLVTDGYKPLITSYVPSYDPNKEPDGRLDEVWVMDFDRFCPEGWLATAPSSVPNYREKESPIPARFYSAHFAFASGDFVREVPHDPEFYFHGEEPSISIRAYTWGYDLFHPHRIICWHEYLREGKTKQWDDDKDWVTKNNHSHKKYRQLFGMDGEKQLDFGKYGLGKVRTLDDYKKYSGVDVKNRTVQKYTKERNTPPNPVIDDPVEYENSFFPLFRHCIDLNVDSFPENDYDFWVVAFENRDGTVLHRQDAYEDEVNQLLKNGRAGNGWMQLWREYQGPVPEVIIIWAHSKSKEWLNREVITIKPE